MKNTSLGVEDITVQVIQLSLNLQTTLLHKFNVRMLT